MVNVWLSSYLVHYKLNITLFFHRQRAKRDKHNAEQKKQQITKKGTDAESDVSSEGDGYLDSQEEDHRSDSFSSLDGEIFWSFDPQYLSLSSAVAVI